MLSELNDPDPLNSLVGSLLRALCYAILIGIWAVHLDPLLGAWHDYVFSRFF